MKNNKVLKNMDVDLDTLQLFNSEEFNKFMSNLLNQDTLNPKTREEVLKKNPIYYDILMDYDKASDS